MADNKRQNEYLIASTMATSFLQDIGFSYAETMLVLRTALYAMEMVKESASEDEEVQNQQATSLVERVGELSLELGV